jgi:lipoprotein-releasing system permease protein
MAFAAVERLIAFRYLRARRDEGFISVIAGFSLVGIALGVGTLIVVMAVMNGFQLEMLRQMAAISGQLGVQGDRNGLEATPDLLARLKAVPGVVQATPSAEGQVIAVSGDKVRGVLLRGMTPEDFKARTPLSAAIDGPPGVRERYRNLCRSENGETTNWGTLQNFGDGFTVAVGKRFADLMGLKVGDRLQIGSAVAEVTAVFCAGMYDYDSNFIYAPMPEVQRLMGMGNKITTIEIFLKEGTPLAAARSAVAQAVGPQGWVFDWFQANFGFFAAIQGQTNVLFIVLTMIVLVAAFNIVSSLVMLVRTKTGDIAILRTMGATRGTILRLFLLDGLAIGGIGAAIGVVLGLAFAMNIEAIRQWLQHTFGLVLFDETLYLLAEMPSHITWQEVATIAGMAVVFALAASLYPAFRAARLDPVEGLRRE